MLYNKDWTKPPAIEVSPAGAILLKAAEVIERYGWTKGGYGNRFHGYCIVGAVRKAAGYTSEQFSYPPNFVSALTGLFKFIKETTTDPTIGSVPGWNDNVAKSKEEVIAKLKEAAYAV